MKTSAFSNLVATAACATILVWLWVPPIPPVTAQEGRSDSKPPARGEADAAGTEKAAAPEKNEPAPPSADKDQKPEGDAKKEDQKKSDDPGFEAIINRLADVGTAATVPQTGFTNGLGMDMIWIAPESGDQAAGFWVSKHEVTQEDYQSVQERFKDLFPKFEAMASNPSAFKQGKNYPVENVSWVDAVKFCAALTEVELAAKEKNHPLAGYQYDLPSVENWRQFSQEASYEKGANSIGGSRSSTAPVGSVKDANKFGLHDLMGNVSEWCSDAYEPSLNTDTELVTRFPQVFGKRDNAFAVVGADFALNSTSNPAYHTSTVRPAHAAGPRQAGTVGFRVVLKPVPELSARETAGGNP